MLYLQRIPAPPLDQHIGCLWYCASGPRPPALERVLPSGSAQLVVNLEEDQTRSYHPDGESLRVATASGTVLAGIRSRFAVIDTLEQLHVMGVSFRPGGTSPFFPMPAHEICDLDLSLELVWGRHATELRDRLLTAPDPASKLATLERILRARWRPRALHPSVAFAIEQLQPGPSTRRMADLAGEMGLSPKRFIENFRNAVGVAPKQFGMILRFQSSLARAEYTRPLDWTRIAADCGYFDQSHFIRDFRAFSGLTPTAYQVARTEFRNHVKFLQSPPPGA